MDDFYTILAIALLIIISFIILFAPSRNNLNNTDGNDKPIVQRVQHPPIDITKDPKKMVCFDPHMQSMNSRKKGDIGEANDQETLASFYIPANDGIPEDFPVKEIGECPYSKPDSYDLPIPNLPMCLANKNGFNMKLNL
jgi:hypothetical protein